MNPPDVYGQPAFDARLEPTWRMLWHQLRVFHGPRANLRAEKLVLRGMDRRWPATRLETLFERLIARDGAPRAERHRQQGAPA